MAPPDPAEQAACARGACGTGSRCPHSNRYRGKSGGIRRLLRPRFEADNIQPPATRSPSFSRNNPGSPSSRLRSESDFPSSSVVSASSSPVATRPSTRAATTATAARKKPTQPAMFTFARSHALKTSFRRIKQSPAIAAMTPVKRNNSSLPSGYVEDKSKGPTLRFQDSLPRLPVPTLEETAKRYLKSLHPLLSAAEFEASSKAVAEFVKPGGPGPKLQERLLARREDPGTKNWIYDWWNEAAYLAYRDPVVPYVSYFYSHRDDRRRRHPAKRAAAITAAVLEFKKLVDGGTLEPEYMKKLPICMDSYQWMFNASRVAARPADYPIKFSSSDHKHFIVVRKNQFFQVHHEVAGKQLNASELELQFNRILNVSQRVPAVGILTSENRDTWADARQVLLQAGPRNKAALEAIESSSFVVCLDDAAPVTLEERARQYWHGDGANRWFDKPLQFIVNDNGTSGFMGEHSMMDGTPTHRLNDYVINLIFGGKIDLADQPIRSDLPEPRLVQFDLSAQVLAEIDRATKDFHHVINEHELAVQAYQGYGKGLIKQFKCSPDAYVQMIIQLAYFKMYGKNRPTYESATTRRFQLGRTETCRSVSDESVAWCSAVVDPSRDEKTKVELFRKAVDAHIEYITAATDGKGVDRHLFGLKKLVKPGEELPAIYKDPAYGYSSSWYLSTSQLSSEYFNGYGWSQVIDGGFGIAYMINENSINFNIVSKCLGSQRMSYFLAEAAGDMRDLLMPTLAPKAKI